MTQEEIKNETPLYYRCEGTATEDFSELRANKKYAEILKKMSFVDDNGHPLELCEDFVDMCERWQKLEAAVAWHGFDEVPVLSKECYFIDIEIIDSKRKITRIVYNKETKLFTESALSSHILFYGDEMEKEGYVGWRYPVGDLSE